MRSLLKGLGVVLAVASIVAAHWPEKRLRGPYEPVWDCPDEVEAP